MRPTEILTAEHRVILRVLDCLERIVDAGVRQARLDGEPATEAIEFLRTFADRYHHGKEEERLFPALGACGLPEEGGPVGVMKEEHEMGRAHVRAMAEHCEAAAAGDGTALRSFAHHGSGFVHLLREHIDKEDHVLFPMAEKILGSEREAALLAEFEAAEAALEPDTEARMLAIADRLSERYGVDAESGGG